MNPKLLKCKPKRWLCPHCGEWHEWNLRHELRYFDFKLECKSCGDSVYFQLKDGYCYYKIQRGCRRGNLEIKDKISIEDIVESFEKPRVTFSFIHTTRDYVGGNECRTCTSYYICQMRKMADRYGGRRIPITLGFEFEKSVYNKYANVAIIAPNEKEQQESERDIESILKSMEMLLREISQMLQEKEKKDKLDGDDDS